MGGTPDCVPCFMTHGYTVDPSPQRREANLPSVSARRLEGLIVACATGAGSAFEQLYKLTSSQLFGVLKRILKTDALAEEALQETYVRIWNHADRYDSEKSTPVTWLVSIARNHAIDLLRKRHCGEDIELIVGNTSMEQLQDRAIPMDVRQAQTFAVGLQPGDRPVDAVSTGPVFLSHTIVSPSGSSY